MILGFGRIEETSSTRHAFTLWTTPSTCPSFYLRRHKTKPDHINIYICFNIMIHAFIKVLRDPSKKKMNL
ncbi:hypothetical protein L1987_16525 [Smallanthus sonchifolius]|uniref:Uncharacterized protein n=1 Tax=Smallanthus sonchifolius TaxID=185202 RepID=A0ACB9JAQ7_9ASTR|nr:hypothetical protein L1987_16525 [Smallanthus sonchifolius]